jgi:hypothetical protein
MSKREYVRQELADIEHMLADKRPDTVGEDMSDLAAIGLARYNPKITVEQIGKLVAEARRNGRSWDQIGNRLGMSGEEACKAYGPRLGRGMRRAGVGGIAGAVLLALRHVLRSIGHTSRV